jgi:hypothetical protein
MTPEDLQAIRGIMREEIATVRGEMREEFAAVRGELATVREEMRQEFAAVRGEMRQEFAAVRGEMQEGLAAVRGEMHEGFAAVRGELAAAVQQLIGRQDRAVEAIASEISLLHGEIKSRDEINGRRFDRIAETLRNIEGRVAGISRWSDTLDRDNAALNASFHELQRTVAALVERVNRIEAH